MMIEEKLNVRYITDEQGNKKEVVLSLQAFEELLEDLHDLAVIVSRKNESSVSFDEVKKKLAADGII